MIGNTIENVERFLDVNIMIALVQVFSVGLNSTEHGDVHAIDQIVSL